MGKENNEDVVSEGDEEGEEEGEEEVGRDEEASEKYELDDRDSIG